MFGIPAVIWSFLTTIGGSIAIAVSEWVSKLATKEYLGKLIVLKMKAWYNKEKSEIAKSPDMATDAKLAKIKENEEEVRYVAGLMNVDLADWKP
jgi:hypothetical protein